MGEVRWTLEAERWLQEIHDYIARDNPNAALRTVQAIYRKATHLADHPEMGYVYRRSGGSAIRVLLYGHYRIAYVVDPDGNVDVLGVFHGALDIDRYLA